MKKLQVSKVSIFVFIICLVSGLVFSFGADIQQQFAHFLFVGLTLEAREDVYDPPILIDGFAQKLYRLRKPNQSLIRLDRPALISDSSKSFRFVSRADGSGFKVTELGNGMYCFQEVVGLQETEYLSKKKKVLSRDQANIALESLINACSSDRMFTRAEIRSLICPAKPK